MRSDLNSRLAGAPRLTRLILSGVGASLLWGACGADADEAGISGVDGGADVVIDAPVDVPIDVEGGVDGGPSDRCPA